MNKNNNNRDTNKEEEKVEDKEEEENAVEDGLRDEDEEAAGGVASSTGGGVDDDDAPGGGDEEEKTAAGVVALSRVDTEGEEEEKAAREGNNNENHNTEHKQLQDAIDKIGDNANKVHWLKEEVIKLYASIHRQEATTSIGDGSSNENAIMNEFRRKLGNFNQVAKDMTCAKVQYLVDDIPSLNTSDEIYIALVLGGIHNSVNKLALDVMLRIDQGTDDSNFFKKTMDIMSESLTRSLQLRGALVELEIHVPEEKEDTSNGAEAWTLSLLKKASTIAEYRSMKWVDIQSLMDNGEICERTNKKSRITMKKATIAEIEKMKKLWSAGTGPEREKDYVSKIREEVRKSNLDMSIASKFEDQGVSSLNEVSASMIETLSFPENATKAEKNQVRDKLRSAVSDAKEEEKQRKRKEEKKQELEELIESADKIRKAATSTMEEGSEKLNKFLSGLDKQTLDKLEAFGKKSEERISQVRKKVEGTPESFGNVGKDFTKGDMNVDKNYSFGKPSTIRTLRKYENENDLVASVSGGVVRHGICLLLGDSNDFPIVVAGNPLLKTPEFVEMLGVTSKFETSIHKCTSEMDLSTFKKTASDGGMSIASSSCMNSSLGINATVGMLGVGALSTETSHSSSSAAFVASMTQQQEESNTEINVKSKKAYLTEFIKMPMQCVRIPLDAMLLSEEAKLEIREITCERDALYFMRKYGSHLPSGLYTLGGVFFRTVSIESEQEQTLVTMFSTAGKEMSNEKSEGSTTQSSTGAVGVSPNGAVGSIGVAVGSQTGIKSGGNKFEIGAQNQGANKASNWYSYSLSTSCIGPNAGTGEDFYDALANNRETWAVIDKGELQNLVPVWDLIQNEMVAEEFDKDKRKQLQRVCRLMKRIWSAKTRDFMLSPSPSINLNLGIKRSIEDFCETYEKIGEMVKCICTIIKPKDQEVKSANERFILIRDLSAILKYSIEESFNFLGEEEDILYSTSFFLEKFLKFGKEKLLETIGETKVDQRENVRNLDFDTKSSAAKRANAIFTEHALSLKKDERLYLGDDFMRLARYADFPCVQFDEDEERTCTVWNASSRQGCAIINTPIEKFEISPNGYKKLLCVDSATPIEIQGTPPLSYNENWNSKDIIFANRLIRRKLYPRISYYWVDIEDKSLRNSMNRVGSNANKISRPTTNSGTDDSTLLRDYKLITDNDLDKKPATDKDPNKKPSTDKDPNNKSGETNSNQYNYVTLLAENSILEKNWIILENKSNFDFEIFETDKDQSKKDSIGDLFAESSFIYRKNCSNCSTVSVLLLHDEKVKSDKFDLKCGKKYFVHFLRDGPKLPSYAQLLTKREIAQNMHRNRGCVIQSSFNQQRIYLSQKPGNYLSTHVDLSSNIEKRDYRTDQFWEFVEVGPPRHKGHLYDPDHSCYAIVSRENGSRLAISKSNGLHELDIIDRDDEEERCYYDTEMWQILPTPGDNNDYYILNAMYDYWLVIEKKDHTKSFLRKVFMMQNSENLWQPISADDERINLNSFKLFIENYYISMECKDDIKMTMQQDAAKEIRKQINDNFESKESISKEKVIKFSEHFDLIVEDDWKKFIKKKMRDEICKEIDDKLKSKGSISREELAEFLQTSSKNGDLIIEEDWKKIIEKKICMEIDDNFESKGSVSREELAEFLQTTNKHEDPVVEGEKNYYKDLTIKSSNAYLKKLFLIKNRFDTDQEDVEKNPYKWKIKNWRSISTESAYINPFPTKQSKPSKYQVINITNDTGAHLRVRWEFSHEQFELRPHKKVTFSADDKASPESKIIIIFDTNRKASTSVSLDKSVSKTELYVNFESPGDFTTTPRLLNETNFKRAKKIDNILTSVKGSPRIYKLILDVKLQEKEKLILNYKDLQILHETKGSFDINIIPDLGFDGLKEIAICGFPRGKFIMPQLSKCLKKCSSLESLRIENMWFDVKSDVDTLIGVLGSLPLQSLTFISTNLFGNHSWGKWNSFLQLNEKIKKLSVTGTGFRQFGNSKKIQTTLQPDGCESTDFHKSSSLIKTISISKSNENISAMKIQYWDDSPLCLGKYGEGKLEPAFELQETERIEKINVWSNDSAIKAIEFETSLKREYAVGKSSPKTNYVSKYNFGPCGRPIGFLAKEKDKTLVALQFAFINDDENVEKEKTEEGSMKTLDAANLMFESRLKLYCMENCNDDLGIKTGETTVSLNFANPPLNGISHFGAANLIYHLPNNLKELTIANCLFEEDVVMHSILQKVETLVSTLEKLEIINTSAGKDFAGRDCGIRLAKFIQNRHCILEELKLERTNLFGSRSFSHWKDALQESRLLAKLNVKGWSDRSEEQQIKYSNHENINLGGGKYFYDGNKSRLVDATLTHTEGFELRKAWCRGDGFEYKDKESDYPRKVSWKKENCPFQKMFLEEEYRISRTRSISSQTETIRIKVTNLKDGTIFYDATSKNHIGWNNIKLYYNRQTKNTEKQSSKKEPMWDINKADLEG
ncbi:hypothetical protein CTEN210_09023 [Chaetoceros tenuissimus]|uniref:Jacalin-type lectin domain-containing protein n=1 Tax=Chaetoceros tenuissimus TaxID=426638 RepID=A0AAD3H6L7_9STRA|nr:hypothetical protein CTEN210_09023 [Chaetoceros tenuissimus]